jgi:Tfp pilus assembly protein PilW
MTNRLAGYTVIEVMLFLTISTVIFVAAIGVFSGRREATQFTQTMQDLQSQFRAYANQVSTSYTPDMGGLKCAVGLTPSSSVARPVFSNSGSDTQDCILLGRAIQVIPNEDSIYAYPVFGLKTIHNGINDTKNYPATPTEAAPEPALDDNDPPTWLGVEKYNILNGFVTDKATLTTGAGEQDLLLLYSSLQNNNTSGNEIDSFSQGVQFNSSDAKADALKKCIETITCPTPNSLNGGTWKLCVKDDSGKKAELLVRATSTGITTTLNMDGCS